MVEAMQALKLRFDRLGGALEQINKRMKLRIGKRGERVAQAFGVLSHDTIDGSPTGDGERNQDLPSIFRVRHGDDVSLSA